MWRNYRGPWERRGVLARRCPKENRQGAGWEEGESEWLKEERSDKELRSRGPEYGEEREGKRELMKPDSRGKPSC